MTRILRTHSRVLQISPVHGPYYAVYVNVDDLSNDTAPLWWKERVPALAIVEEWSNYSDSETPPDDAVVERTIRAVSGTDGYLDTSDPDDSQLMGFFYLEGLDDQELVARLNSEATAKRREMNKPKSDNAVARIRRGTVDSPRARETLS